jgi:hypothetical protein
VVAQTQTVEDASRRVRKAKRYEKQVLSEFEKLKTGVMVGNFKQLSAEARLKRRFMKKQLLLDEHLKTIERNQNRIKDSVEETWGVLLQAEEKRTMETVERARALQKARLAHVESETREKISDQYVSAMVTIEKEMHELAEQEKVLSVQSFEKEEALRAVLENLAVLKHDESRVKNDAAREERNSSADPERIRTSKMLLRRMWRQGGTPLASTEVFLQQLTGAAKPTEQLLQLYENHIKTVMEQGERRSELEGAVRMMEKAGEAGWKAQDMASAVGKKVPPPPPPGAY